MKKTVILSATLIFVAVIIAAAITYSTYLDMPFCRKPYILVGKDCCLDENDDKICDRDKPVSVSLVTTTSISSTTIQYAESTTTSTLRERTPTSTTLNVPSTTTRIIQQTTTTQLYSYSFDEILEKVKGPSTSTTTTSTLPPCVDSDGGLKYEIASSNVSGIYLYNGTRIIGGAELCEDGNTLMEYYCESGLLRSLRRKCSWKCINGRCCKGESSVCNSDKDCCSGTCRTLGVTKYCVGGWAAQ